jgi:hypothetical protein
MTRVRNAFVVEEGTTVPIDPQRGATVEEFVTKIARERAALVPT